MKNQRPGSLMFKNNELILQRSGRIPSFFLLLFTLSGVLMTVVPYLVFKVPLPTDLIFYVAPSTETTATVRAVSGTGITQCAAGRGKRSSCRGAQLMQMDIGFSAGGMLIDKAVYHTAAFQTGEQIKIKYLNYFPSIITVPGLELSARETIGSLVLLLFGPGWIIGFGSVLVRRLITGDL